MRVSPLLSLPPRCCCLRNFVCRRSWGHGVGQAGTKLVPRPWGASSVFPDGGSGQDEPWGIRGVDSKTHSPLYLPGTCFELPVQPLTTSPGIQLFESRTQDSAG